MYETMRGLLRQSAVYGLTPTLARVLGFVLLPIYTRHLTAADYGVYTLLIVTGTLVGTVVHSGLGSALFREMIYLGTDRARVQSTALYYLVGASVVGVLLMAPLSPFLAQAIVGDPTLAPLLVAVIIATALDVVGVVGMARLRADGRAAPFAAVSTARFAATAAANIWVVAVLRLGVPGLVAANLTIAAVFSLVWLGVLRTGLRPTFDVGVLRRLLAFGVPLIPFGLGYFVMTYADRYLLRRMLSATEVGQYAIGYQIGMTVALFVTAVQLAWPAVMFDLARRSDAELRFSRLLTYYVAAVGFVALAIAVLSPEVVRIMTTPEFYVAATVVPYVAVSYLLYGILYMTNTGLETRNKVYWMTPTIVGTALVNVLLNLLLIPRLGIHGAAWATLLSFALLAGINLYANLRIWRIPYEYARLGKVALVMAAIFALGAQLATGRLWVDAIVKLLVLALFPVGLRAAGFFDPHERRWIRGRLLSGLERLGGSGSAS